LKLSTAIPEGFFDYDLIGLDLETTSLSGAPDPHRERVLLISLANEVGTIVLTPGDWLPTLWEALKAPGRVMLSHNSSFDLQFLWSLGFEGRPTKIWDTMLAEQVLLAGLPDRADLAATAWRRIDKMLDKAVRATFMRHIGGFSDQQLAYAGEDAEVLIPIFLCQYPLAQAQGLLETIVLENAVAPIIAQMEWDGVGFDVDRWDELKATELENARRENQQVQLALELPTYTYDLFDGGIRGINLNSWQQVLKALHHCGIGVKNTRVETFEKYLATHPEATVLRHILAYRSYTKRAGYNYGAYVHSVTGRIHTDYRQLGAVTGRLSSSRPNLQNIPRLPAYRALFIARPGWSLIKSDMAQQEMRILAEASGDSALMQACLEEDVHITIARRMYREPGMCACDPRRDTAKNSGFAMSYGASAMRVAITGGIPLADAEMIVSFVRNAFPQAMAWGAEQARLAKDIGYVLTLGGRRRNFVPDPTKPDEFWDNQARNAPIQGTAADVMKRGLVNVDAALRDGGYQARLVLTVHDELVVEAPEDECRDVAPIITREFQRAGEYYVKCVPMPVDAVVSPHWKK